MFGRRMVGDFFCRFFRFDFFEAQGTYGGLNPLSDNSFCRGVTKALEGGKYEFVTQEPGAYGSLRLWFGSKWVLDPPPYGPRHIHVIVFHPRMRLGIFQLYFANDPAREFDWRGSGDILRSNEPRCELQPDINGMATFDFVLKPLEPTERSFANRTEAILDCCGKEYAVPGLCSANSPFLYLLRLETFYVLMALILYCKYALIRCFVQRFGQKVKVH